MSLIDTTGHREFAGAGVAYAQDQSRRMPQRRRVRRPGLARRPVILHITGDYPDGVREPTTQAIKRLIDGTGDADHVIFSLKRLADPGNGYFVECDAPPGQRLFAFGHFGLPLGAGLFFAFARVARRIARLLEDEGITPDIIHSHRLTFDGIAGWLLARRLGIPHFVSVRGEVESKVFRFKPTYRPLMKRILQDAARIYCVSAWFAPHLEKLAGPLGTRMRTLPNIIHNTRKTIPIRPAENAFVIGAQLDVYKRKGVDRLIAAFARTGDRLKDARLDIYGTGSPRSRAAVERIIGHHGLEDRVRLMGQVPNEAFLKALPHYLALAMPARNETFGMVYTEALFAGVPLLYGRRTGIDGYLDEADVGVGVDPMDVDAIAEALVALREENEAFRARIARQAGALHRQFDPERVLALYRGDIAACIPPAAETGRRREGVKGG